MATSGKATKTAAKTSAAKTPTKTAAKTATKTPAPTPAKKVMMVVEGDSWEHLPDLGLKALPTVGGANYDLARALTDRGHTIHNLAYWGDTIAEIAAAGDYLKALRNTKAPFLLLGGGGNDILGEGRLKTYLLLYEKDRKPEDYVLDVFYRDLRNVILHYETILDRIAADRKIGKTTVIVHGYDYARPMKLGWIGNPLKFIGVGWDRPDLQNAIIKVLIDALNEELKALARRRRNVVYVDFRGKVGEGRWHDELHPTKEAFRDLARILEEEIA